MKDASVRCHAAGEVSKVLNKDAMKRHKVETTEVSKGLNVVDLCWQEPSEL